MLNIITHPPLQPSKGQLMFKPRFAWFQGLGSQNLHSDNGPVCGKPSAAHYLFLLILIQFHDVLDQAFKCLVSFLTSLTQFNTIIKGLVCLLHQGNNSVVFFFFL